MRPRSSDSAHWIGNLAGTARRAMGRALPALLLVAVILAAATLAPPPAAEAQATDDATLSSLTLSPDNNRLRPAFMSDRNDYFAWYPSSTATVTVAATATVSAANVAISPADSDTNTDGHQVSLSPRQEHRDHHGHRHGRHHHGGPTPSRLCGSTPPPPTWMPTP